MYKDTEIIFKKLGVFPFESMFLKLYRAHTSSGALIKM